MDKFYQNKKLTIFLGAVTIITLTITIILLSMLSHMKKDYENEFKESNTKSNVTTPSNATSISQKPDSLTASEGASEAIWYDYEEEIKEADEEYIAPASVTYPYFIKVNRAANCVTVYGIDDAGEYTIPVKAFICSCGREGHATITGDNYSTSTKYEWATMVDGTQAQCAFRIWNSYMFHSIPYMKQNGGTLEEGQFNLLGEFSSLGCIRMCYRDIKWIYDNCPSGTKVTIYDDAENPGPLGKPEMIKIPEGHPNEGWDPTDTNPENPWLSCEPEITGVKDITTSVGTYVDVLEGVKATDTCGNDITSSIKLIGRYTFDVAGNYEITYKVTDLLGKECTKKITLTVE